MANEGAASLLPSIKSMYQLVGGRDNTWGLEFYEVSKVYEDPIKVREARNFLQSKVVQKKPFITKKGHYLDDLAKMNKTPGPGTYTLNSTWENTSTKKLVTSERKTFVDWIFSNEKKNKFPAPNCYAIGDTEEKVNEKKSKQKGHKSSSSQKTNFVNTCEFMSLSTPGPGNYNPRPLRHKSKDAQFGPEQIRKQHIEREKLLAKKIGHEPSMVKYNPAPLDFHTFERMTQFPKQYGQKKNYWGTEVRILAGSRINKKGKQNTEVKTSPGPGQYNMIIQWKGKTKEKDPSQTSTYLESISHGRKANVYN